MKKILVTFLGFYCASVNAENPNLDPDRHHNFHNVAIEPISAEKVCGEKFYSIKIGNHFFMVNEFFHDPMCPCSDEELDKIYELIDSQ